MIITIMIHALSLLKYNLNHKNEGRTEKNEEERTEKPCGACANDASCFHWQKC